MTIPYSIAISVQVCCFFTTKFGYRLTTTFIYVTIDGCLKIYNNMSGIYILQTKDGYRVAHTHRYDDLVGMNAEIVYYVNGNVAKELFSNCFCYDILDEAIEHAQVISKMYLETDDGICVIKYAKNLTFKELIKNGKNTGR